MSTESQTEPDGYEAADLEFTTEPKEQPEDTPRGDVSVSIDGRRMVAHRPTDASFSLLASVRSGTTGKLAMIWRLLESSLDEMDFEYIQERAFDRDDAFDLEHVATLCASLAEKWLEQDKAAAKPRRARARG